MTTDTEPIDIDTEPDVSPRSVALRSPQIPVTLTELAALKGEATAVIEARVQVIATLRTASIRATSPPDWVLHKAPDEHGGQIVAYLQDAGADRVRDLWGVEIFNVSKPEKIAGTNPEEYHYVITGSGHCKLTRQTVENMEGGRSSTDEFCKDKVGLERELLVRKAARANLDGGITRELTGMKSVPIDDLRAAWVGTTKQVEQCRLGRGFGSRSERIGGRSERAPDVEPPVCPHCNTKGVYRPAKDNRKAFYGCPNYSKHPNQKWIVDAEKWVAEQQRSAPAAPAPSAAATAPVSLTTDAAGVSQTAPLTAAEIPFAREPGQEG